MGRSLVGKALALRNAGPPVPVGGDSIRMLPGSALGGNTDLTLIQAYKSNGTVQSNVSLLAGSVAAQKWKLYRAQPADGRVRYTTSDRGSDQRTEVIQHAAINVLDNPAVITVNGVKKPLWDRMGLFEVSQIWLESCGKSHWVVDRGANDSPVPLGLWPVRPDRMTPVPDKDRFLAGWVYTSPDGRERIPLLPTDVIFNRYPDPEDLYGGCGPIQAVLTDIEAARYASEWNRNYFINSAEPGGVIQVDHSLDDEEFNELVDRWRDTHRGVARAHRIAVLEAGATWIPNMHTMKDMDFAGLRTIMADHIREALGMHKVMTGISDDVNRANAQTGEEVFASWKVAPRLDRWRNVLNSQFLPLFGAQGSNVEFDYIFPTPVNREQDALELRTKSEAALALVTAGYDQHDVLEAVGLPDMEVGLTLTGEPALPPRWTVPPPSPAASPGKAAPAGRDGADTRAALLAAAGWESPAWQQITPSPVPVPGQRRGVTGGRPPQILNKNAAAKAYEQQSEDYPAHAMAWMHHATWIGPVKVPLDHVDPDMKWMDGADPDHVADFVKRIKAGKKLKPVILVKTPEADKLKLADGHHRWLASAEMEQPVRAFIATVDAEHGDWETMHDYQRDDGDGAERGSKAALGRQMAAWNRLAGVR